MKPSWHLKVGFWETVVFIVLLKSMFAALTPLGYDFVLYTLSVIGNDQTTTWSPWIILVRGIYSFWAWLPMDHGNIMKAFAGTHTPLLPSYFLLSLLVKTPLLFGDLATAALIYRVVKAIPDSEDIARRATMLWLVNPFITIFVEMWGSVDIITVALSMVALLMILRQRGISCGAALAASIALKLNPIMMWLTVITWIRRHNVGRKITYPILASAPLGILGYLFWFGQGIVNENTVTMFFQSASISYYTPLTQTFSEYSGGDSYRLGLAIAAVATYFLICSEIWPRPNPNIISLGMGGLLLLYAFAYWFPPAFIWVVPLISIWWAQNKSSFPTVFYMLLALLLIVSFSSQLTSNGSSLLFIPAQILPFRELLLETVRSTAQPLNSNANLAARSVFSGFCVGYAALVSWRSLRKVQG